MRRCVPTCVRQLGSVTAVGAFGLAVAFGTGGCAARREATERHLRSVEDQVDQLTNANGRLEMRIASLEMAARKSVGTTSAAPTAGGERPPLDVVKLGPPPAEGDPAAPEGAPPRPPSSAGAAPDDAPRLMIRGTGDRLEARDPGPTSWLELPRFGPRAAQSRFGHTEQAPATESTQLVIAREA